MNEITNELTNERKDERMHEWEETVMLKQGKILDTKTEMKRSERTIGVFKKMRY